MELAVEEQQERAVADHMQRQNDLCAVFRQVLEEEAAEYGRQNRQCNQHYEGI